MELQRAVIGEVPVTERRERLTEELAAETRKRAEAEAQVQEISLYNTAILEQAQVSFETMVKAHTTNWKYTPALTQALLQPELALRY